MTAPLLWHRDHTPITIPNFEAHAVSNGDVTTIVYDFTHQVRPAGQLWERVADQTAPVESGRRFHKGGVR